MPTIIGVTWCRVAHAQTPSVYWGGRNRAGAALWLYTHPMAFSALCLLVLLARTQANTVSIRLPATSAPMAIEELGKAARVDLRADGELRTEILILRLQKAPLDTVMKRIAQVCEARWCVPEGIRTSGPLYDRAGRQDQRSQQASKEEEGACDGRQPD